jgi:hypothetical protein
VWKEELNNYSARTFIPYNKDGLEDVLKHIEKLTAGLDRIDAIKSEFQTYRLYVLEVLTKERNKLGDELRKVRMESVSAQIARGLNADERKEFSLADVRLVDLRIVVRMLEDLMDHLDSLDGLLKDKVNTLNRALYSCGTIKDALTLGLRIGEL